MKCELSASMMCADFANLSREVQRLGDAGIDSYHIDIMDGCFVDNFGMGYQDMEFICRAAFGKTEVHLMINDPERYLRILEKIDLDVVYIHPESTHVPEIIIEELKKMGIIPGIAINPSTSISSIEELLNIVDRVLVLCVTPGHAGRALAPYVIDKIYRLLLLKDQYKFEVFLDGACTKERILEFVPRGVRGFVLGTALLFGHGDSYQEILTSLRRELGQMK